MYLQVTSHFNTYIIPRCIEKKTSTVYVTYLYYYNSLSIRIDPMNVTAKGRNKYILDMFTHTYQYI